MNVQVAEQLRLQSAALLRFAAALEGGDEHENDVARAAEMGALVASMDEVVRRCFEEQGDEEDPPPPPPPSCASATVEHNISTAASSCCSVCGAAGASEAPVSPRQRCKRVGAAEELLAGVSGVLIDLDGTMYTPAGLIQGADDLYAHLLRHKIPHCFVSNTGAKGALGVQSKLKNSEGAFALRYKPVALEKIVTAAEVTVSYLATEVPWGSKLFVIAGGSTATTSDGSEEAWWMSALRAAVPADRLASWDVRTYLSERDARRWAALSSSSKKKKNFVSVVMFSDGEVADHVDPATGERGFADWSFDCFKKTSYLLSHGAQLIVTAEDSFNPAHDAQYPGHVFPLPGPGMFAAAFRKLMYPRGKGNIVVVGKGGESCAMVERALEMLAKQGCDTTNRQKILLIGDRFDTDVAAGVLSGLETCLVESGAHEANLQSFYPDYPATYVCSSILDLLPLTSRAAVPLRRHSRILTTQDNAKKKGSPTAAKSPPRPSQLHISSPSSASSASSGSPRPPSASSPRGGRKTVLTSRPAMTRAASLTAHSLGVVREDQTRQYNEPRALVAWALASASVQIYGSRKHQASLLGLLADFFYERHVEGHLTPEDVSDACEALGLILTIADNNGLLLPNDAALTLPQFVALIRSQLADADHKMFPRRGAAAAAEACFLAAAPLGSSSSSSSSNVSRSPSPARQRKKVKKTTTKNKKESDVDDESDDVFDQCDISTPPTPPSSSSSSDWIVGVDEEDASSEEEADQQQQPPQDDHASQRIKSKVVSVDDMARLRLRKTRRNHLSHGDLSSLRFPPADEL